MPPSCVHQSGSVTGARGRDPWIEPACSGGESQALRLPEAYWFEATEVRIRRHGAAVILEPLPGAGDDSMSSLRRAVDDFIEAVREALELQERPEVDRRFG